MWIVFFVFWFGNIYFRKGVLGIVLLMEVYMGLISKYLLAFDNAQVLWEN